MAGCGNVHAGTRHLTRIALAAQWDEAAVDLTAAAAAWPKLSSPQRAAIGALVTGFSVAEDAVAEHLAPFVGAAPDPASAVLLSLQQSDEARHARFFARIASEVCGDELPPARPALVRLFGAELPAAASALARGEMELGDAMGLYHLILEGLVLGIGQEARLDLLADGALPGVWDGIVHVQRDERWHVGFGISCLVALDGTRPPAERLVQLALDAWGPDVATIKRLEKIRRLHARRLSDTTQGAVRSKHGGDSPPPLVVARSREVMRPRRVSNLELADTAASLAIRRFDWRVVRQRTRGDLLLAIHGGWGCRGGRSACED